MLRKLWTIAFNDLRTTFSDRNALLIMIAAPLALATIIGLAFGGIASGEADLQIPVALVNLDQPADIGGEQQAFGAVFNEALVPPADATAEEIEANGLWNLVVTQVMTDAVAARAAVDAGDFVAAVIIPPDFSARLAANASAAPGEETTEGDTNPSSLIEVYGSQESPISVEIVRGIMESIATEMSSGVVAINATIFALIERAVSRPDLATELFPRLSQNEFLPDFEGALTQPDVITVDLQSVSGEQLRFDPFLIFGIAQAIFFMLFTAMAMAGEFLREKRDGRLGRMLVTPTRTATVVLGKILGAIIVCASQVLLLMIAFTVVSGVVMGEWRLIFGTNFIGLLAVVAAVASAAAGVAMLIASLVNTPELAQGLMAIFAMANGVIGGAFFDTSNSPFMTSARSLSINFWGVDAITRLAQGNNAILLHLGVLLTVSVATLAVAFFMFNRRLEA